MAPGDSARRALGLVLREELPTLLDVAALACYLSAFLGLPGRTAPRRPWPRALPVAAAAPTTSTSWAWPDRSFRQKGLRYRCSGSFRCASTSQ